MSIFLGIAIMFDFINAFIAVMMNDSGRAIIFTIIGGVLFYLKIMKQIKGCALLLLSLDQCRVYGLIAIL